MGERKRKLTGIGLIVVGVLFLLVTNGILIGWRHIWPLFPVAAGVLLLRNFRDRGNSDQLFAGLVATILGAFLLLFSVGILEWTAMETLWPTIPVVVGGSMLAGHMVRHERGSMILEIGMIVFGFLAFLFTTDAISSRVAAPFVRFWPVVLILAGAAMLKLQGRDGAEGVVDDRAPASHDAGMDAVRAVLEDDHEPETDEVTLPTSPPTR
jgi:hypothetical protein